MRFGFSFKDGRRLILFSIVLSSRYSENINSTDCPLKFTVPSGGFTSISCGGISSIGPPGGAIIAAHEKRKIIDIKPT
jgi:hypothetical protein